MEINTDINKKRMVNSGFNDYEREKYTRSKLNLFPNPEMRLYGIYGNYFESYDELIEFCQVNGYSLKATFIMDYIRSFGGYYDVIRKIQKSGKAKYYTAVDENYSAILSMKKSKINDKYIWGYKPGSLINKYKIFKDRGIIFENNLYPELSENGPVLKREKK